VISPLDPSESLYRDPEYEDRAPCALTPGKRTVEAGGAAVRGAAPPCRLPLCKGVSVYPYSTLTHAAGLPEP
jgi:hypothetical protein